MSIVSGAHRNQISAARKDFIGKQIWGLDEQKSMHFCPT
jgi:hypothetical protein